MVYIHIAELAKVKFHDAGLLKKIYIVYLIVFSNFYSLVIALTHLLDIIL
jgi:hypothetical protein